MRIWKGTPSSPSDRFNYVFFVAIAIAIGLLSIFVCSLIQARPGEVAAAIGSILGGIVGAGGAVIAVYLLISQQRNVDKNNISKAVLREVIECCKIIMESLDICT